MTNATYRADGWCQTCGNPIQGDRCACWCHLADALQRYLGMDFDGSAQMASDLWEQEADKGYVWSAQYAADHDVTTYPPPPELAVLQEQDARGFPHDTPCPRCGRRQWAIGDWVEDPMNPSDKEQETCGYCGYEYQEN